MPKNLVLGALVILALTVLTSSGHCPIISLLGTETISAALTPQATAASTQKTKSKAQTIAKAPQLSPSILAINDLVKAAKRISELTDVCFRSIRTLESDTSSVARDPVIKRLVDEVYASIPWGPSGALIQSVKRLQETWNAVASQGKTD